MLKKIILLSALSFLVVACSGDKTEEAPATVKVKPMQKNDKNLSCREILLEMNEAEYYNRMAHKNRGVKLKNVLMPLGYISTYMDSEDAIGAAEARVQYLDKIYEIMRCDDQEKEIEKLPVFKAVPEKKIEKPKARSRDVERDVEEVDRDVDRSPPPRKRSNNSYDRNRNDDDRYDSRDSRDSRDDRDRDDRDQ